MKKLLIAVFALIALSGMAQNGDGVEERLREKYTQFLKEEGFMPNIDDDGDVMFKKEGSTFFLRPTSDEKYFKLSKWLSNEDTIKNLKIHQAMNVTNAAYKGIKVYSTSQYSGIWIEVGNFLAKEDEFEDIFYRSLNTVSAAKSFFLDQYNDE